MHPATTFRPKHCRTKCNARLWVQFSSFKIFIASRKSLNRSGLLNSGLVLANALIGRVGMLRTPDLLKRYLITERIARQPYTCSLKVTELLPTHSYYLMVLKLIANSRQIMEDFYTSFFQNFGLPYTGGSKAAAN